MPIDKAESSRINGAKSRGPITPEGKQRSSLNSVRHGLLAKVSCLTNEDQELFKELLQDYLTRLQPTDMVELRLVEQVASAAFRLERMVSNETALFDRSGASPRTIWRPGLGACPSNVCKDAILKFYCPIWGSGDANLSIMPVQVTHSFVLAITRTGS